MNMYNFLDSLDEETKKKALEYFREKKLQTGEGEENL